MFEWDPRDYAASSSTQILWARELWSRIEARGDESVLDVGCGDGRFTAELACRLPRGRVVGIDNSRAMVDFAQRQHVAAQPNLEFIQMDARRLRFAGTFDIVFSNAALHWVDDHPAFLHGAARALKPGGRLLVSCGGRGNAADVFAALRVVLRGPQWRRFFRKMTAPYFFHDPADYQTWLTAAGFRADHVRLAARVANHPDVAAFTAWFRTTWLPYTQRVPEPQRDAFIGAVVQRFLAEHPPDAGGGVQVRMVRLEIAAATAPVPT